jgi:hypothetical protein
VASLREYLEHCDYLSGSGKKSRQFNFAVDVVVAESVGLQEHDSYTWTALNEETPVTDVVKEVLRRYCAVFGAGSASLDFDQGTRIRHGGRIPQLYPQAVVRLGKR